MNTEPITDVDAGTTYTPWQGADGQVGFRAVRDGQVSFVYLNPSGGGDGEASVFVYQGSHGDLDNDQPLVYVNTWASDPVARDAAAAAQRGTQRAVASKLRTILEQHGAGEYERGLAGTHTVLAGAIEDYVDQLERS